MAVAISLSRTALDVNLLEKHRSIRKQKTSESKDCSPYEGSTAHDSSASERPGTHQFYDRAPLAVGYPGYSDTGYYANDHSADLNGTNRHIVPPKTTLQQPPQSVSDARPVTTDSQLSQTLLCETNAQDGQSRFWDGQQSTNDEDSQSLYSPDSPNTITVFRPKQKRNSSNRSKMGCVTCRERKRKCDEAHPICEPLSLLLMVIY